MLDDGTKLSFVDQRTFGGWMLADMVEVDGSVVPVPVAHLARDPLDPHFDPDTVVDGVAPQALRAQAATPRPDRGIGNRQHLRRRGAVAREVNGARMASSLCRAKLRLVLDCAAEVLNDALRQGGTSFDSLYVNVNGESGYFDRSLDAYGREGPAVPPLRSGDPPREVHEPLVVLLPALPAPPARLVCAEIAFHVVCTRTSSR